MTVKKNKDGFEPGQMVTFAEHCAHMAKKRNEKRNEKPAKD